MKNDRNLGMWVLAAAVAVVAVLIGADQMKQGRDAGIEVEGVSAEVGTVPAVNPQTEAAAPVEEEEDPASGGSYERMPM